MSFIVRTREWTKEFLAVAVWEGIKLLFGVALSFYVFTGRSKLAVTLRSHTLISGVFLGAFLCYVLFKLYQAWKYHQPLPKQQYDFEQVKRDITFEYRSSSECVYRKKIALKALRPGLSFYTDKYMWTGKTQPSIHSAVPTQLIRMMGRKSVWQFYAIEFGRSLNKSEIIETDLVFDLRDDEHSFVPFVSTNIEEPTKELFLRLHVPPALGVKEATCEIASCMGARVPFSTKAVALNSDGIFEWHIDQPKMHLYYELRWAKPAGVNNDKANNAIAGT